MLRRTTTTFILACTAAVGLWAGAARATPVTSIQLIEGPNPNFSLTVEDKTFNQLSCSTSSSGTGVTTGGCDALSISPLASDGPVNSDPGIQIQGGLGAFAGKFAGFPIGPDAILDIGIKFAVTAAAGFLIHDVDLIFDGRAIGTAVTSITETIFAANQTDVLGQLFVTTNNDPAILHDHIDITPSQSIFVTKDIFLNAKVLSSLCVDNVGICSSSALVSFIFQRFSETGGSVPEPATLGLLGAGLLGLGMIRRRRQAA